MTEDQLYAIIGSNVVAIAIVGGVIGTFFWRTVARLDRRIDNDKASADADRRAFQGGMDDFRREMQDARNDFRREMQDARNDFGREMLRLAERQSHLEGARSAADD